MVEPELPIGVSQYKMGGGGGGGWYSWARLYDGIRTTRESMYV